MYLKMTTVEVKGIKIKQVEKSSDKSPESILSSWECTVEVITYFENKICRCTIMDKPYILLYCMCYNEQFLWKKVLQADIYVTLINHSGKDAF